VDYLPLTLSGAASTDVVAPQALNVLANGSELFVAAWDTTANTGYLFGYKVGSTSCSSKSIPTLTALSGSPWRAGKQPSAVASSPNNEFVYVTDFQGNAVYGFAIASNTLTALKGSPYPAGNQPSAIVVDAASAHAYAANSLDNTMTAYSIGGGALTSFGTFQTSAQPQAVLIDPSTDHFVYAAGYLGASVSGYQLVSSGSPNLIVTQTSPYTTDAQPMAMAAIPHGGTATKTK
jgi:6-phosphogluconolactonase